MTKPYIGEYNRENGTLKVWTGETWATLADRYFEGWVAITGDIVTIDGVKYKRIEE